MQTILCQGHFDICFISNVIVNDWKNIFDNNQIKIEDGLITDAKFKTYGCVSEILMKI